MIDQFSGVKFSQPQTVLTCLNIVAKGMSDPELPVRIRAAIALGSLIAHEEGDFFLSFSFLLVNF